MIFVRTAESISNTIDPALLRFGVLEQAARQTLQQLDITLESDLTILLTDDTQIQALNSQFLEVDAPTDVLSFPSGDIDPDTNTPYLGDVLISYPRALAQASAGAHTLEDELILLVVHGVLHLLGYDHMEETQKTKMWAIQGDILSALNNPLSPP